MVHFNITQIFLQCLKSEIEYSNEKQVLNFQTKLKLHCY